MSDNSFPREFSQCPKCFATATVTRLAAAELLAKGGHIKPDVFLSMRKMIVPLIEPSTAVLSVPAMIVHYDICFDCGTEYCIKVEKLDLPITFTQVQGGKQLPFGRGTIC